MIYLLAATRNANGTATLAAPIIKSIELTASQCFAASNPFHVENMKMNNTHTRTYKKYEEKKKKIMPRQH